MTVVCDTSALMALVDASEAAHGQLVQLYERQPQAWVLPAAILPEADYLVSEHLGGRVQRELLGDLAAGRYTVAWGCDEDLSRAAAINARYPRLRLGWVDTMVMACAVRFHAKAIATLDLRHFGAVALPGQPQLWPRDAG
ncbi:MAG TPA: PIN domain-containing protein [Terriglobales bacterium]|nr:PIN domain-containing protein [Terriglobales bacterium]